jgi:hypothetical protein
MTLLLFALIGLLAFFLVGLEVRRPDRRRLPARITAGLLAVAALALLAAEPSHRVVVNSGEAILLTAGASADTLRALLASLPGPPSVWTIDSSLTGNFAGIRPVYVPYPGALHRRQVGVQTVHLLGYGLPASEFFRLDSLRVVPHLTAPATSLRAAHWTGKVALGEEMTLQGEYQNASAAEVLVRLVGFGRGLDSVPVAPGARQRFTLRTMPKQTGRFVFTLESRAGEKLLSSGPVPFQVTPRQPLRVLFLESFPTFGGKFLKAYLSGEGHRITARAAISKGKYRTEFLNTEQIALNRLTPALLDRFDLVILDDASLRGFARSETALLLGAVRGGMGVLVWASEGKLPATLPFSAFNLVASAGPEEIQLAPRWSGSPPVTPPVAFPPLSLQDATGIRPLAMAGKNGVVAAVTPHGLGRVTVVIAGNTLEWMLAGQAPVYASYWSHLITATARQTEEPEIWQVAPPLPVPDVPATLQLVSADPGLPELFVDNTAVYPQEAAVDLGRWESTFWPRQPGWHAAKTAAGEPFHWYVYRKEDWPDLNFRNRYEATLAYLAKQSSTAASAGTRTAALSREEAVPLIWLYALFLLSAGYLWVERKL